MEKKFCRRVDVQEYEYFTYNGTEEGRQKALEWVKSFAPDATLEFTAGEWRLCSLRCGCCIYLPNHPWLLLHRIGCDEFFVDDSERLGKDYQILPTDYFDED